MALIMSEDEKFMLAALKLSESHLGQTSDNPSVGAIVVKDGAIIGRGVTARGGRPHAEPLALRQAGAGAAGACLYVTLEPCCHHGRTPPCIDAIIAADIQRVVVGILDPDPRVAGQGIAGLRRASIEVVHPVLEEAAANLLEGYLYYKRTGRPFVTLKLASFCDGVMGLPTQRLIISNKESWGQTQRLRAKQNAILVGINTVLVDDPQLTCRLEGLESCCPIRVVVDLSLQLPLSSCLVDTAQLTPTWVIAGEGVDGVKKAQLEARGVRIIQGLTVAGRLNVDKLLDFLAAEKIVNLLVEGGLAIAKTFLEQDGVNKFIHLETQKPSGVVTPEPISLREVTDFIKKKYILKDSIDYGTDLWREWIRSDKCLQVL